MTRKQKRLGLIGLAGLVLGSAVGLVLYGLSSSVTYFQSPSDIAEQQVEVGQRIRLGGLVEDDSLDKSRGSVILFRVTDQAEAIPVSYKGILPDLFREGQGIIAEGHMNEKGVFIADTVLAKHDESYMPKEVYETLKEDGHWMEEEQAASAEQSTKVN
ncbi:Cytochrome c-type biogenesis protein CcmE [Pseudovibrio sp. Ad46]|uniref:cytochrome c maturation protein CcmE n=1 Tax=unclassified Pseudovibrio TaxID=2627060 RepID=UPI0007B1A5C0|nr:MULTISPECIES: cytochrome c maturation protein CcmE [unclassified Pseudovibrio]KZK86401.1 Cytochrome c-type biogenesis protein CcmE [Pseudovibrio sp. Ad46]KZK94952.1 Cytochrome c-type biogenesis protein CcmE [Pseudovibrio sp. W74]KZL08755.1 Cytochrome c-type biogenesis protein CcmE [Pseudovibrio sp. Ad14]